MKRFITLIFLVSSCYSFGGELIIKVVDVGNGLGCLIKTPDDKYFVYDAGNYKKSSVSVFQDAMKAFIPLGSDIEIMFLSHEDADHIMNAGWIVRNYNVKTVYHTGFERSMVKPDRPVQGYTDLMKAFEENPNTANIDLNKLGLQIQAGATLEYGDVKFSLLSGFGYPPAYWGLTSASKKLNSISIVLRVEYLGKAVLFCGDEVGSLKDKTGGRAEIAEKLMIKLLNKDVIKSDVIIASHHGATNGNSLPFIKKVNPTFVICSAGTNSHGHPRTELINRFLKAKVKKDSIFCTDRGAIYVDSDGNPHSKEWTGLVIDGCEDKFGDDGIDIVVKGTSKNDAQLTVKYVLEIDPCLD